MAELTGFHLTALGALIALAACGGEPPKEPPPRIVETVIAAPGARAAEDRFPAQLRADDRGAVGFEVGGVIADIRVDIGDTFRKGQILATLDPRKQRLATEGMSAQLDEAVADAEEAALDYKRKSALAGTGAVAQSVIDAAARRRDQTSARVANLRAERGRVDEDLDDTRLYAPYAGSVVGRPAQPSEVVAAGQAVLEITGSDSGLEAVISVPDRLRGLFTPGRSFRFLPSETDAPVAARVTQVNAAAGVGGLFEVLLAVPGARQSGLAAGSRGEIVVARTGGDEDEAAGETGTNAIILPLTAIAMGESGTASVFVVDPDTAELAARTVVLGEAGDAGVAIKTGLDAGEIVVTKGVQLLRNGETVRATSATVSRFNP
ncbi:MAG: efflux RND transporter periplasmic adaptor subunit [Pseudomonadota bacterium]